MARKALILDTVSGRPTQSTISFLETTDLLATSVSGLSNGAVLFASGTVIGQNPTYFYWDDPNRRLHLGLSVTAEAYGRLNIRGANLSYADGPHVVFTNEADNYPLLQILPYSHDNINITFDAYFDGVSWKSSDAGSNYQIRKSADTFGVYYAGGVAVGGTVTWLNPMQVNGAGSLIETVTTAITNSVGTTVLIKHNTTGTAAAGFGSQFFTQLDSSTTANQNASSIITSWSEATHASRKARIRFAVYDTTSRTALDIDTDGAQPYLTLYGPTEIAATDTTTALTLDTLVLSRKTSGTPATFFGGAIAMQLDSTTTEDVAVADIGWSWVTATHASRKPRLSFTLTDTSPRGVLVLETDGAEAMMGFMGASAATRRTSGANLTNNVTAGGVNDTITNWTNLSTYSTDAAAIRNAVYQLARKLKQINDGLRTLGLFD